MSIAPTIKGLLWRPNNYRLKIKVKPQSDTARYWCFKQYHTKPTKKGLLFIKDYAPNITLEYGKKTLTAIFKQNIIGGKKETYHIERNSIDQINKAINKKKDKIKKQMLKALTNFSRKHNISLPLEKPMWSRYEDWIKGEEYIDKIPRETIIHDTYFKKVYGEGVEFMKAENEEPTAHMKNYIKNRCVEDISPHIASELRYFNYTTGKLLAEFSTQIRLHLAVLRDIDMSFKKFNEKLTQKKLGDY